MSARRACRRLAGALALALAACGRGEGDGSVQLSASFGQSGHGPPELALLASAPVTGRSGPEGHAFDVRLRTPRVTSYPCASCHERPVTAGSRADAEHADVRSVHPSEVAERCETCHAPADPARLTLQTGETASLDEAYRLCAQCHFSQTDAWAGGAHGKRLVGWQGRRVVMSCTECHDPHAPVLSQQIPFRGPTIPRATLEDRR